MVQELVQSAELRSVGLVTRRSVTVPRSEMHEELRLIHVVRMDVVAGAGELLQLDGPVPSLLRSTRPRACRSRLDKPT
jgi:hypothetical protein